MSLLQLSTADGGTGFPNVKKYYQASRLVAVMDWWRKERAEVWNMEQQGVLLLLKEWALLDSNTRSIIKAPKGKSSVYDSIMSVWGTCQQRLAPNLSLLVSFLYHPGFREAASHFEFQKVGAGRNGKNRKVWVSTKKNNGRPGYSENGSISRIEIPVYSDKALSAETRKKGKYISHFDPL